MKKYILAIIFIILAGLVLSTVAVNAQGLKDASGVFKNIGGKAGADTYEKPEDVIGIGIGAAITLVGMIFLVLMVYAGYLWMTARGEQEQVDKAQKIITTALIGFFIVASAYAITKFVSGRLGGGGSEGEKKELPPLSDPVDTKEECEEVGGGCIADYTETCDYESDDPCDPGGLGCEDPYTSDDPIGTCEGQVMGWTTADGLGKTVAKGGKTVLDSTNVCCMKD